MTLNSSEGYLMGDFETHPEKAFLVRGSSPFLSLTFPQLFGLVGIFAGVFLYFILKKKSSV
jgi:hypothetical protein